MNGLSKALGSTGLFLLLALAGGTKTCAAPSFDCRKAKTAAEKAICADKKLADMDKAMAEAFVNALARLGEDAGALAELRRSQKLFLTDRDVLFAPHVGGDYDLAEHMSARLAVLRGIGPDPRMGFEGDWKTTEGSVWVGPPGKNATRPVNATSRTRDSHWSCEFLGEARMEGEALIVEGRDKYKKDYDGWRLKLTREGRLLDVETLAPDGARTGLNGTTPICSGTGSLGGLYFPQDAVADDPCAGVPAGACRE